MENNSEQSQKEKMEARKEMKKNFSAWVDKKIEAIKAKIASSQKL